MDSDPLEVTIVDDDDGVRRVIVRGELDIATAPELLARLPGAGTRAHGNVLLDLDEVTFIDSSGLEALLTAHRRLGEALRIRPSAACARLFEITGLSGTLPIANG
jgi:anti-anti-sigma factor